jgi:hypothetical protein
MATEVDYTFANLSQGTAPAATGITDINGANPWSTMQKVNGGTITADSVGAASGVGLRFAALTPGATAFSRATHPVGGLVMGMAFDITVNVFPSSLSTGRTFMQARPASGSGTNFRFNITPAGKILISDQSGVASANKFTANETLSAGVRYRIELTAIVGTTSTSGGFKMNIFQGSNTTPINATPYVFSNWNLNTSAFTLADTGVVGADNDILDVTVDNFRWTDGRDITTSSFGPFVGPTNQTPSATVAPTTQMQGPGSLYTSTATPVDPDGSITSRAWTWVSYPTATAPVLSGATTDTVSATLNTPGKYVVQYTATDNLNTASSPVTVTWYVWDPTSISVRSDVVASSGWSPVGAVSVPQALADASSTTGVQSPTNPFAASVQSIYYNPIPPSTAPTFKPKGMLVGDSTARTVTFTLVSAGNNTPIASWSASTVDATERSYEHTLTGSELGNLTNARRQEPILLVTVT